MSALEMAQLLPRQTSAPTSGAVGGTSEQLLKLLSNPFQAALQMSALWFSLGISLGLSVLLALLFSLVRPRHRLVYAPKTKHADAKHAPPPMGNGLFDWFKPVTRAKEDTLIDKVGMDATVFLRFLRMLRNMFVVLGFVGVLIMIPVNVALGNKDISTGGFAAMTPLFVFGNGLWAQVVVAWTTDIIVAYFLWHNYRRILQLRRNYLESPEYQASLHARTLLISDLPREFRSEDGITQLTDEVNPTGVTPKITIGRNMKELPDLIEEHEEAVRHLESVLAKYLKNPDRLPPHRPTMRAPKRHHGQTMDGKVDAIEYLTDRIRELEAAIGEIRARAETRDPTSYGFASWEQISQAHTVAFAAMKKKPHGAKIELAPRPSDLIWKNLSLSKKVRRGKRISNAIWITVLTLLWMPLNAAIAIFLSNLSNLGSVWSGFQASLQTHKAWWALVQGIAAPAITSTVYLILPIIFRRLQIRAGDVTKTEREQHVVRNLFTFFTLNNLIVFSLFSSIWQFTTAVIDNNKGGANTWEALKKGQFFLTITTSLCQISPFWVTWLLQRSLGAAIDLAQLWKLWVIWFERTFLAPTPRQNIEWTAPTPFDYASYYNYFLFYSTVALCFSTLQPIVLVVTAVYFTFDSVLKKYLLMYVFVTKNESGGQMWPVLFNRLVFATMLSDIIIAVVVKARGTWSMVIALAPPFVLMGVFKWYCSRTFDADMKFYSRTGMVDPERQPAHHKRPRAEKISAKFGHPALHKPLMTPMVNANARAVLSNVYRGRLHSEANAAAVAATFSDIAMQDMKQDGTLDNGHPHQPSINPSDNAPFEYVPEGQQDFSYYKNRPDFADEDHDDFTSRASTPMSYLSMGKAGASASHRANPYSPVSSREGSPAPDSKRISTIKRKEFDPTHVPVAFRSGTPTRLHTAADPFDDRTNLLRDTGDPNASTIPSGEFMSMDRWQSPSTTPGMTPGFTPGYRDGDGKAAEEGSYDYFRGRQS